MVTDTSGSATFTVLTARFGPVEVSAEQVLQFTAPLLPFVQARRFALLASPDEAPFVWLQAADEPALALVVAPYEAMAAMPPPAPSPAIAEELGCAPGQAAEAYVIVSIRPLAAQTTVNLLAPIYVCRQTLRARQVILDGDLELVRVPLLSEAA
jgi:flagellar assembly factor FliW